MSESATVLLLDDGELESVATIMRDSAVHFRRLRSSEIEDDLTPPVHLLITTPRHAAKVRRGSPPGARPGRPVRIIVVEEDSPSMRRMLRNMGFHLLVRQPAHPEVWRLLIQRSLYQGEERRREPRLPIGSEVDLMTAPDPSGAPKPSGRALLIDISNRGCHLVTQEPLPVDSRVRFSLWVTGDSVDKLDLSGQVVRSSVWANPIDERWKQSSALLFDIDLEDHTRMKLARLINSRITGASKLTPVHGDIDALPATECPDLPGLALDDETDPPVPTDIEVDYECEATQAQDTDDERRESRRAEFPQRIMVMGSPHTQVLMGRDLSSGGMRVERLPGLAIGDRFNLALYGPAEPTSIRVKAEVIRDDGPEGLALRFDKISPEQSRSLEKFVACLPAVESLDGGEIGGMGAIISEILPDDVEG